MDRKTYQMLQQDLAKAVKEKNIEEMLRLKEILQISDEQAKYFEKGLTGYPSVDEVWYKYYIDGSKNIALSFPRNKTVWDEMEVQLKKYYDYPAIKYFKKETERPEFIDNVYRWARVLKAVDVKEDDIVPIYGPFTPDVAAITFALNLIGATGYFLKLAMGPESFAEETKDAKIAIVYDGMWSIARGEFSKDKYKNVFVYSISQNMPSPKKEIVSFLSYINAKKNKTSIPKEKKYIWLDKAKEMADYYTCQNNELKAPFRPKRNAYITSSSGTTGGIVKGVVATNESVLAQIYQSNAVDVQYHPGDRILNHFPPTASTSLNSLFLIPLYHGSTVMLDPRVTPEDFYNQIIYLKPTLVVNTGSAWELFFDRVEREMNSGKTFDFSYSKGWVIGGEGTDVKKFLHWQEIMKKCNAPSSLSSAYGQSELFSAITSEQVNARGGLTKQIMSVGIPYSGISVGVYDADGRELTYNKRGEVRISGNTIMKEYYNKPDLTKKVKIDDEIYSGDIGEMDENGFLYVWGRKNDEIKLPSGKTTFLFDIGYLIKSEDFIYDAMVFRKGDDLVAHITWNGDYTLAEKTEYIRKLNELLKSNQIEVCAFKEYDRYLPYSATTLKKDRNLMMAQSNDFIQVDGDTLYYYDYIKDDSGNYQRVRKNKVEEIIVKKKTKKKQ